MINKTILAVLATLSLAACATGPGYYGGDYRSQSDRNYYNQRGCNTCGEVTSVQRTYLREGTSGGGAVLGAAWREVAPDLAPAEGAIVVFDAHKQGRSVVHDAERGLHRRGDRAAEKERLDAGRIDGGRRQLVHGFKSIST